MSIRLSAAFYKATIDKFALVKDDPLAFPILLGFLDKASQSRPLLQGAKDVVGDDEKFRSFYQKTRSSLPPGLAQIVQKHEEKIREKLRPMIEAETRNATRAHELETELRLRKEFEDRLDRVHKTTSDQLLGAVIQAHLQTMVEIGAIKERYDAASKHDRIHKYIGYAVGAVGVAVSVVSWPSVWNRIVGQSEPPAPLEARLASSGQCLPSDTRVEIKKDSTTVLPSSGTVCLDVPEAPAPIKKDDGNATAPIHILQENGWNDSLSGKSLLDLLNDGQVVNLFKQDGSSICLHMPKPIPCIGAEAAPTVQKEQKEAVPPKHHIERYKGRHFPKRYP